MGRNGTRLPGFCLNRIRPHARVRSPPIQSKYDSNSAKSCDRKAVDLSSVGVEKFKEEAKPGCVVGRKIMIVSDSSAEAKAALQWALSHSVQSQDTLILLYVAKPSKKVSGEEHRIDIAKRTYDSLASMKNMCQCKRPEVHVEIAVVEGKERGPIIVEEAKKQEVAMLVLGQKKKSMTWRLLMMWAGNRVAGGVVEYCIQNASCMAIAVRRKSKKLGGYLITTKRHKDFWLLA
ncbi:UspA [Dillenia turbinata]|uniref:UspA n=1 Tax=Dillenia turbinata TaxID=194707 RepID=A0AAN8VQ47_9MAGN